MPADDSLVPASVPAPAPSPADPRLERVAIWFETLTPATLADLASIYADDARFKDPFNEVQGTAAIRRVFEHMYVALREPRFVVRERFGVGCDAFLAWEFLFRFRRGDDAVQCVRGATHLKFGPDGRIVLHRDYWDAAEELYEKLPAIGSLMRWLKRRAAG
jgi:ketosteroid isomerase-like protein